MKYRNYKKNAKKETSGGDYWRGSDFFEHLKLTEYQTTYQYLVKKYLPPLKVLEAGCGLGRWVIPLAEKGYDVTGLEIESEAIGKINQYYSSKNLRLVQGDVFNMSFPDKTFDLILSLGVLEHFEDPLVQKKAIAEHLRVMKDDGTALITVPLLSFVRFFTRMPYVQLLSLVRFFKGRKQYFTDYCYSKGEFQEILEKNNLTIIDVVYDDLQTPFNWGLTVDYPINVLFRSKDNVEYKANKSGNFLFRSLWKIHPKIVSGAIGFICKKKNV